MRRAKPQNGFNFIISGRRLVHPKLQGTERPFMTVSGSILKSALRKKSRSGPAQVALGRPGVDLGRPGIPKFRNHRIPKSKIPKSSKFQKVKISKSSKFTKFKIPEGQNSQMFKIPKGQRSKNSKSPKFKIPKSQNSKGSESQVTKGLKIPESDRVLRKRPRSAGTAGIRETDQQRTQKQEKPKSEKSKK